MKAARSSMISGVVPQTFGGCDMASCYLQTDEMLQNKSHQKTCSRDREVKNQSFLIEIMEENNHRSRILEIKLLCNA